MLAKSQEKVGKIQGRCWEIVGKMSAKYCKNISKMLSKNMMQGNIDKMIKTSCISYVDTVY